MPTVTGWFVGVCVVVTPVVPVPVLESGGSNISTELDPLLVLTALDGTTSTFCRTSVWISALTVMPGLIRASCVSKAIFTSYETTPCVTVPIESIDATSPVIESPSIASKVSVAFCPAFTLVASISLSESCAMSCLVMMVAAVVPDDTVSPLLRFSFAIVPAKGARME